MSLAGASLLIREGEPSREIGKLLAQYKIETVFLNREDTPYGLARDKKIIDTCRDCGADAHICADDHLTPPGLIVKDDGSPYTVFTPYYKKALKFTIPFPRKATLEKES